jgi:enoyl-CoA hydratase/carnithine racemase
MAADFNGLRARLRDFLAAHEQGWNHHEWLELLGQLTDAGVDTTDPDAIGVILEQERVAAFLAGLDVKGLGPRRREAVAERFGRLWDLRHATVEELAGIPTFHQGLAEALHEAIR